MEYKYKIFTYSTNFKYLNLFIQGQTVYET